MSPYTTASYLPAKNQPPTLTYQILMTNIITPEMYYTNARSESLIIFKNKIQDLEKIRQHMTNVIHFMTAIRYSQTTMMNRSYELVGIRYQEPKS